MKLCKPCGKTKPLSEFPACKSKPLGVGWQCRECSNAASNTPAAKARRSAYHKAKYRANPDAMADRKMRAKFGMSLAQYDALLFAQGGECAICGTASPGGHGRFHIDHNHKTGAVRGLLCTNCNTGLGHFIDFPELLEAAAEYLRAAMSRRAARVP